MSTKTTKPTLTEPLQGVLTSATEAATLNKEGADSSEARAALQTKVTKDGKTTTTANSATVALSSSTSEADAEPSCCCLDKACCCCGQSAAKPAKS
jgi:hypothetical protein